MKKLFVVLALFATAFLYAEPVTKVYKTGDIIYGGFRTGVFISYKDIYGKIQYEYPNRIYAVIPYQDGYLLKVSFRESNNYGPVAEFFVKPGTELDTKENESTTVVSVKPNQIELKFVPKEKK